MTRKQRKRSLRMLTYAILAGLTLPAYTAWADDGTQGGGKVSTADIHVEVDAAQEEAKTESQQKTIITKEDIEKKQAKSVEDIIFSETGVSRTVDSMGRVGISIRGAEARHTLILVDGQPVLGDLSKYQGAADEVMRLGTENVERIEIVQGAASAKYGSDAIGGVVNIITKKATKEPGLQFNMEGLRRKGDQGLPFSNFFLRADSGQLGKFRIGLSGAKRDMLPVWSSEARSSTGMDLGGTFGKNSLRFYGEAADIGTVGTYEADAHNTFEFRLSRYNEDLHREIKNTDSGLEPQRIFKRKTARDSYNLTWKGDDGGNTDWTAEMNYTKIKEDDTSLLNYLGYSAYTGTNELNRVDNVDHKQIDVKISANTMLNDKHILSYGFGYSNEKGEGARVSKSPNTTTKKINPWDYDKSLLVDKPDRLSWSGENANTPYVWSHVHDYAYSGTNTDGTDKWDINYEYYGYDESGKWTRPGSTQKPGISYEEYLKYRLNKNYLVEETTYWGDKRIKYSNGEDVPDKIDEAFYKRYKAFDEELRAQNPTNPNVLAHTGNIIEKYFTLGYTREYKDANGEERALKYNGKYFMQEYWDRDQRITTGSGTIQKKNFFIGDTWQMSKNTFLFPVLRVDHSNLFGTNISGSIGLTHNLGGSPHARFKANIGTSYAEPGMGELWYNWEMYASSPVSIGTARMGWWWQGNPNLKPEKAVNIDMGVEGETKNTYARVGVFHNRIRDYMSIYFTGGYMDFAPQLKGAAKWMRAPDMIYSFKNIGRAEITGLEAEIKQKFGPRWSGKLGYTYLHAVNKSDPLMPRQLLDRPTHKIDIGISYEDKKTGWGGTLWGDYYIRMLDSNTLANNYNYYPQVNGLPNIVDSEHIYKTKTYGIWNIMVQKKFGDDAMVYFGVNNIFNHRDDARAMQERVFRIGANFKFGGYDHKKKLTNPEESEDLVGNLMPLHDFIKTPFDPAKAQGVEVFGDYRARMNIHGGIDRPSTSYTPSGSVTTGLRNLRDSKDHNFEQRIRVGAEARIGDATDVRIVGSASGTHEVDTKETDRKNRGFSKQRLEEAAVTHHIGKWDLSAGRIHEPLGATEYWFGKEYDGIRAVWTNAAQDTQVRLGYGTFKHSTGITDSAYTHAVYSSNVYRPPTVIELLGLDHLKDPYATYENQAKESTDAYNAGGKEQKDLYLYQQLKEVDESSATDAEKTQKKTEILKRFYDIVSKAYGAQMGAKTFDPVIDTTTKVIYKVTKKDGSGYKYMIADANFSYDPTADNSYLSPEELKERQEISKTFAIPLSNSEALTNPNYFKENSEKFAEAYQKIALSAAKSAWKTIYDSNGAMENSLAWDGTYGSRTQMFDGDYADTESSALYNEEISDIYLVKQSALESEEGEREWDSRWGGYWKTKYKHYYRYTNGADDIAESLTNSNYTVPWTNGEYKLGLTPAVEAYLKAINDVLNATVVGSTASPDANLGAVLGNIVKTGGNIIEQDRIPEINQAVFVQAKKMFGDRFGMQLWYLHSLKDETQNLRFANGTSNDVYETGQLANVFGIGAKWQVGRQAVLSGEYGQNRTDFGRLMNGSTVTAYKTREAVYDIKGREKGSNPSFWTLRLDIGKADTRVKGSWGAFADYKAFQHGSFFGGNGTAFLPDRYLDGMKSMSVGAGYVPIENLLLEAAYTFNVHSLGKRDTLYGSEKFTLGNMASIQLTYRF